tara:strand:+ start:296 stop:1411 length:1116 start_codon:yes stop_codon:yes gene_type:complete
MIPLWKPSIGKEESELIQSVLNLGYLGHGSYSDKFEVICSSILNINRENLLACSTGHAGLHLILNSLFSEESLIATPTFNNIADFQAILNNNCIPLLLDSSDSNSPYISPETLSECIKENKIDAFIALDYASNFCPLEEYYSICNKHGVKLIYDAAHSFGSINEKRLNFCDAAMFSFDPIKTFTCIDGGLIYFKDTNLVSKTKPKRFIGMQQNESKLKENKRTWDYDCSQEGWRYHLSNIHAAVGISQINRIEEIRNKRSIAMKYMRKLILDAKLPLNFVKWDKVMIPFMNVALINSGDKIDLQKHLDKENIQSGTHWKPGHLFTKFKPYKYKSCKNAEDFYKKAISLPLFTDLEQKDIKKVYTVIKNFYS